MTTVSRTFARTALALILVVGLSGSVPAQEGPSAAAPADVESAEAIIAAVYDVISGPAGVGKGVAHPGEAFAHGQYSFCGAV